MHHIVSFSDLGDPDQELVGGGILLRGHSSAVVAPHIEAQKLPQRARVGKGTVGQHVALQGAKPVLDRVQIESFWTLLKRVYMDTYHHPIA